MVKINGREINEKQAIVFYAFILDGQGITVNMSMI